MKIREMFAEDINRPINGVIKVDQDEEDVIKQEVQEYVITKELKRHFVSFFDYYSESFNKHNKQKIESIGVWISGFFGSGKSHFLKMLSYILENKSIDGIPTVERFRDKFSDDPATFMMIDQSTMSETETILFNIDIEGSINKDNTAVLRVFAKMFYKHLGFYGENLKVAMLEKYIDRQGKTDEFRRVFEEKKGKPWLEQRKAFAFNGKFIVPTLMEVLDMSEEDAKNWFNDKSSDDYSISVLVEDIKEYVKSKPKDFRLLFMADEVGQYIGTDTNLLLNLQSLVEKISSECNGKVWVICTGQEAIDEIIKVRENEFSRIQARFKTRLSLSSSSVDEVIRKRVLKKKPEYEKRLEKVYDVNDSALRNLYTFSNSILDIKGFEGPKEFSDNFPFVPYQFIIMQKVFAEIRKHGNSGSHLSGGERSMLSGFQEAAQKVQDKDEFALVPFFRFYDTVHTFLDGSIRRVIERCQNAADSNAGIKERDVDVLKLLYLIRYVDDIPANLDNIVILMTDDIRTDKIELREKIRGSLERLQSQNYIGRSGDIYNFLTDEEQDIAREIRNTVVDTTAIVHKIGEIIFGDIYPTKKYRYGRYDFSFDQKVDDMAVGAVTGAMCLRFLTVAADPIEKENTRLVLQSKEQALVVLPDGKYYEFLENAMKIEKYLKGLNVSQQPASRQAIIRGQQDEAEIYKTSAKDELKEAIEGADFYVDGELLNIKGGDAKSKIDNAMEVLVGRVYSGLDLITKNAETDDDIYRILRKEEIMIPGNEPNLSAAANMEEFLEIRHKQNLPTSMADVQSRYKAIPYGWREIDIAAVAAQLIAEQKVTIKYSGTTIQPDDPKLPDMLRKRSEIGRTTISKRVLNSAQNIRKARDFLREYFDVMDVPTDEDGLIAFIIERFGELREEYIRYDKRYEGHKYPDHPVVIEGIRLIDDLLSQKSDNIALIRRLIKLSDALEDNKENMQRVIGFFNNQVKLFDEAVRLENTLLNERDYLTREPKANAALNQIRLICIAPPNGKFDYNRIPELNGLMSKVHDGYESLLTSKREELLEYVRQCLETIHTTADENITVRDEVHKADKFYSEQKLRIAECESLALLDGMVPPMLKEKDKFVNKIEAVLHPTPSANANKSGGNSVKNNNNDNDTQNDKPETKKKYKMLNRSIVFPARRLETEEDVNAYVKGMKDTLLQYLKSYDGIDIN